MKFLRLICFFLLLIPVAGIAADSDYVTREAEIPAGSRLRIQPTPGPVLPIYNDQGQAQPAQQMIRILQIISASRLSPAERQDLNEQARAGDLVTPISEWTKVTGQTTPTGGEVVLRAPLNAYGVQDGKAPDLTPGVTPPDPKELIERIGNINRVTPPGESKNRCPAPSLEAQYSKWLAAGVPLAPLRAALACYHANQAILDNKRYITIADFTQSSKNKRMYILDVQTGRVETQYVAHGAGSSAGRTAAKNLRNTNTSLATPPGFMLATRAMNTAKGPSLLLAGLETRNRITCQRGVFMHGADYVTPSICRGYGCGLSHGCPALPRSEVARTANQLKGQSLYYHYANQPQDRQIAESGICPVFPQRNCVAPGVETGGPVVKSRPSPARRPPRVRTK